ncbi:hypothetical protein PIB30_042222 [Stylosanthes scabra]|uniref:Uncharacterized protein n=1 Tax=Stylosanthes scabra TaxID=79078 RepID=A0ABU6XDY7_9FABA|nr:hypothetical protein [Stylosanthes scabra]
MDISAWKMMNCGQSNCHTTGYSIVIRLSALFPNQPAAALLWLIVSDSRKIPSAMSSCSSDSNAVVAELGKLKTKVELLKLKASVANRRLNLAMVIGSVG